MKLDRTNRKARSHRLQRNLRIRTQRRRAAHERKKAIIVANLKKASETSKEDSFVNEAFTSAIQREKEIGIDPKFLSAHARRRPGVPSAAEYKRKVLDYEKRARREETDRHRKLLAEKNPNAMVVG